MVLQYTILSSYRFNSSVHLVNLPSCVYVCHIGCDLPWTHPSGLLAVLGSTPLVLPYPIHGWREGTRGRAISASLPIDCHVGMLATFLHLWMQLYFQWQTSHTLPVPAVNSSLTCPRKACDHSPRAIMYTMCLPCDHHCCAQVNIYMLTWVNTHILP